MQTQTPTAGADEVKRHTALKLVMLAAACFYVLFIVRTAFRIRGELYFTLIDDAMVSMRYGHHLAQGHGLVWNVGEKPVEGFTNPGWMFFMAGLHLLRLPASKISLAVMVTAAVILTANAWAAYQICEELEPRRVYAPLMAAIITAFNFPLVFWSLRGMEVGILALLTSVAVLCTVRMARHSNTLYAVLLGASFVLALLVRLDALLQIAVISVYAVSTRRAGLRSSVVPMLIAILTIIGILWFQRAYFGDFLPNTYYQKVAGTSLVERAKNGILAFNQYATRDTLMLTLLCIAGAALYRNLRSPATVLLAMLFIVQCAYSIGVGGDYAEPEVNAANRFITQGIPFLIILCSLALDYVISDIAQARDLTAAEERPWRPVASICAGAAVLLVISGQPWMNWAIDNAPLWKADIRRVKLGLEIAEYTSPTATIAVHAAGQIPYYSDRRTIDLLGLNDPVVAKGGVTGPFYPGHDKWNYDYSIRQLRPDLIADNWIKLGDYMRANSEYQRLANGMYARKDSTLVNIDGLAQEYR